MSEERPSLLTPELALRLQALSWRARQVVDGLFTGAHKSPHHGASIEFAEHKEYSPGDDPRHLDWKAYARFDRYTIKKYENETNLRTYLLLDASASMAYGEGEANKLQFARVLAAGLAYMALRQQDAPGLAVLDESLRAFLPPRGRLGHFAELGESLLLQTATGKTDLAAALDALAERLSGRNRIVLITDALVEDESALIGRLASLSARKNEVALLQVLHPDELDLPFDYLAEFVDLESGERLLAEPSVIRAEYRRLFSAFCQRLRQGLLAKGVAYQLAKSDEPPLAVLLGLLAYGEEGA